MTNAPIIGVSWHDAKAYCKWLSKKRGEKFDLPTESEWEYACWAGTTTKWSFGDDEKELEKYARYRKNLESKTHPVGEKLPNPWGLYDMHGNVWECVKIGMIKIKKLKSFGVVRGSTMIASLAPLSMTGMFRLFVTIILGFVSLELYLLDWGVFRFGFFTF